MHIEDIVSSLQLLEKYIMFKSRWTALLSTIVIVSASSSFANQVNEDGELVPASEADTIKTIVDSIAQTVNTQAATDKDHKAHRDAHAKGHACVQAEFKVKEDIPQNMKVGLFEREHTYQAIVRFSNGSGKPGSDASPDGRGMAIKVLGVTGPKILEDESTATTQDFLLINYPVFFVKNAADYIPFNRATKRIDTECAQSYLPAVCALRILLADFGFPHRLSEMGIILGIQGETLRNPLSGNYFSMTPYKLGEEQVKYSVESMLKDNLQPENPNDRPDFLRERLVETLASGSVDFDFKAQIRTDKVNMPVEDPTVLWDRDVSVPVAVAQIHIPQQTGVASPEALAACENLSFTPWHSLPEHRPLGGINRVRKAVYMAVSKLRHDINKEPRVEP